jgi:GNAT superfamily N-acetyltransferase/uncharacterized protein YndB with AHSA1/START domain
MTTTPPSPALTIRPLDVSSDTDMAQLNALDEACDEANYGAHDVHTVAQRRAILADSPYWTVHRWVAEIEQMEGGSSIVGLAMVFLPLQENLDAVDVGLAVHPAFRGQGVGTALVEQALRPAVDASGRHLVSYWGEIPADGDADDPALPTNKIAARLGLSRKHLEMVRAAPLPLDAVRLEELGARAQEKLGDYRVELWEDTVPTEHLEGYGVLLHQLDLDDPDEEIESEAAEYPPERIRVIEQRRADAGTCALIAVAVAPDGTFVGNSEIHVQRSSGTTAAWQENTLVMPDHRGHRLGMAMKVATHRALGEKFPDLRTIVTWNSHVNPWMIGINEDLGYRVACREIGYQGRVGEKSAGEDHAGEERVVSTSRVIAAPAADIFELIADPAAQPRWDGNDNLAEAADGQRVHAVEDVFTTRLTKGAVRENHVVEFEEGRRIAWCPAPEGGQPFGQLWRWQLEPIADGVRVTHTYDWTRLPDQDTQRLARARATTSAHLAASIERLAALAEGEPAR